MTQQVEIFWTGGWDSTFRILELSRMPVEIRPWYVRDPGRGSTEFELRAMKTITAAIRKDPRTVGTLHDPLLVELDSIEADAEITASYERLKAATKIGSQYDWLARFAKAHRGIEYGLEKADSSKIYNAILAYGALEPCSTAGGSFRLNRQLSSPDLVRLLENITLPIIDKTKQDMRRLATSMGSKRILAKTWFCHSPFLGRPCGLCNPCKSTLAEGLGFRFTPLDLTVRFVRKLLKTGPRAYLRALLRR